MQIITIKREQDEKIDYLEKIAKQIVDKIYKLKHGEGLGFVLRDFSPWALSLIVDYVLMDDRFWNSIQLTYDEDLDNKIDIIRIQTLEGILQIVVRYCLIDYNNDKYIYYIHVWRVR